MAAVVSTERFTLFLPKPANAVMRWISGLVFVMLGSMANIGCAPSGRMATQEQLQVDLERMAQLVENKRCLELFNIFYTKDALEKLGRPRFGRGNVPEIDVLIYICRHCCPKQDRLSHPATEAKEFSGWFPWNLSRGYVKVPENPLEGSPFDERLSSSLGNNPLWIAVGEGGANGTVLRYRSSLKGLLAGDLG